MAHRRLSSSSSGYSSSSSISPGKKGRPRSKFLQKLQAIVICDHEKSEAKPLKMIRTRKLLQYVRPIGQVADVGGDSSKTKKEPELQRFGCKILTAIENFVHSLHKKEYTLKGKININMLYWVKSSQSVKLRKDCISNLEMYTKDDGRKDYSSIGTTIRKDLFRGQKLPIDLQAWIGLMLDDPLKHKYLIRYNTALLHRRAKMDHFLSLYEKLLQVQKLQNVHQDWKQKYKAVVDNVPVGIPTPQYVWTSYAMNNKYVKMVYDFRRQGRSSSVFGLLEFVRDCIHHLMDYSIEDGVIKFGVDDKYLMIETCFRGVFHQFQQAMAEVGFEDEGLKESC